MIGFNTLLERLHNARAIREVAEESLSKGEAIYKQSQIIQKLEERVKYVLAHGKRIEDYEKSIVIKEFNALGPELTICDKCQGVFQYPTDHACPYETKTKISLKGILHKIF